MDAVAYFYENNRYSLTLSYIRLTKRETNTKYYTTCLFKNSIQFGIQICISNCPLLSSPLWYVKLDTKEIEVLFSNDLVRNITCASFMIISLIYFLSGMHDCLRWSNMDRIRVMSFVFLLFLGLKSQRRAILSHSWPGVTSSLSLINASSAAL